MDIKDLSQPRIDLRDCETVKCENCGGIYFKESLILKKVSKLQGAPMDQNVPVPVFRCEDCGHINKGFNPFEENSKLVENE